MEIIPFVFFIFCSKITREEKMQTAFVLFSTLSRSDIIQDDALDILNVACQGTKKEGIIRKKPAAQAAGSDPSGCNSIHLAKLPKLLNG